MDEEFSDMLEAAGDLIVKRKGVLGQDPLTITRGREIEGWEDAVLYMAMDDEIYLAECKKSAKARSERGDFKDKDVSARLREMSEDLKAGCFYVNAHAVMASLYDDGGWDDVKEARFEKAYELLIAWERLREIVHSLCKQYEDGAY